MGSLFQASFFVKPEIACANKIPIPIVVASLPTYTDSSKTKIRITININNIEHIVVFSRDTQLDNLKQYNPPNGLSVPTIIKDQIAEYKAYSLENENLIDSQKKGVLIVKDDSVVSAGITFYSNEKLDGQKLQINGEQIILITKGASNTILLAHALDKQPDSSSKFWQTLLFYGRDSTPIRINLSLTSGEKDTVCNNLNKNWEKFKDYLRELYTVMPGSEGSSPSPFWEIKSGMTGDVWWESTKEVCSDAAGWIEKFVTAGSVKNDTIINSVEVVKLQPTSSGKDKINSFLELASLINMDIETIKNSGSPECGNVKFIEFKWDKSLEKDSITFSELSESIGELVKKAAEIQKSLEEPVRTAGVISNCDGIEEGNSFMMLIKKAICATLEVFKSWADAFVTWAIGWMKASMGVTDSSQDMTTPDLDPGTGNVLNSGSSTSSGSGSTGNTSSTSSVTTAIDLANDNSVKINSSDVAKIKTEAEKNSGVISAKIFETDSSGKINAAKGMAAQIKIVSPGKKTTAVEVKAQDKLTYANSLLMFSADGKNYKISIINDGTGLKFDPAEITEMSGTIPELPGSASDSSSDLQNGSSSESSSTNNFRVLGFVKPSKNIADPKDYQKRYTEFKKDYQENINKITIQYGTNNEGSDKDDGPYKGAISVYDWKDNEHIFKFKVIGKTKLENVKETAYIKIGNGSKIFFTIKPRKKSINSDEYKTYFFK